MYFNPQEMKLRQSFVDVAIEDDQDLLVEKKITDLVKMGLKIVNQDDSAGDRFKPIYSYCQVKQ